LIGSLDGALWNTLMLCLPDFSSSRWIRALEKRGFLLSAGSACSTGHEGPSHVLAAMGVDAAAAARTLRISSGWATPLAEWEALAAAILESHRELRADDDASPGRVLSI
jgi:cysteine desulfurase